jgi:hypothetical protein
MLKKIFIGLGILVVIFAVGLFVLYTRLDMIVSAQIEKYGTRAAQSTVTVSGFKLSVNSGQGSISGLKIGSPKGFSAPYSIKLDSISVTVDRNTITGSGPIIIKEIVVDRPQVNYEILENGQSNLSTISRNAQEYAGSSQHKADRQEAAQKGHPERKVIIDRLVIQQGEVEISQPMLKLPVSAKLPTITLTGLGRSESGTTPDAVAGQVLEAITSGAARAAGSSIGRQIGDQLKSGNVKELGDRLKGLLGK